MGGNHYLVDGLPALAEAGHGLPEEDEEHAGQAQN